MWKQFDLNEIAAAELGAIHTPVPPEQEIHRIVAKVDEIMALCDQLAARLKTTRELSATYASVATEAVLKAA